MKISDVWFGLGLGFGLLAAFTTGAFLTGLCVAFVIAGIVDDIYGF